MKNIDWKNVLLTVYHASLVLGAAYAASHADWAWSVAALTSLAGLSQAPSWVQKAATTQPAAPAPTPGAMHG